jgi:hypothetical protein
MLSTGAKPEALLGHANGKPCQEKLAAREQPSMRARTETMSSTMPPAE